MEVIDKKSSKKNKEMSVFTQIRKKTGMSQERLARLLGVSYTSVNRWEAGKQEPKLNFKQIKTLSILLRGMGVEMEDLPDSPFGEIQGLEFSEN